MRGLTEFNVDMIVRMPVSFLKSNRVVLQIIGFISHLILSC